MCTKKQQLQPYMEQMSGSKLGKEYNKAVYYHPIYLTYMQRTSCKMLGWIISWDQDWQKKYQQPQKYRWCHTNGRKWRVYKEPLDEDERGRGYVYTYGWFMLMFDKKQQNSVKQLPCN